MKNGFEQIKRVYQPENEQKREDGEKKEENPENSLETSLEKEKGREEEAREIAQLCNYEEIKKTLEQKDLLESQIERVKKKYENKFEKSDFAPDLETEDRKWDALWEVLTALELYDEGTAEHCVGTYVIAKEKINKVFSVLGKKIILSELIKEEGLDLARFYLACAIHDIGKIEIPSAVLNNKISRNEWGLLLNDMIKENKMTDEMYQKLGLNPEEEHTEEEILNRMSEKNIYPNMIVPFRMGANAEEIEQTEESGFSTEQSLKDIIQEHATRSGNIMRSKGFPKVASVVEQHHKETKTVESFPVSVATLEVSHNLATIIHLADVEDALKKARSYKPEFTKLKVLAKLIDEIKDPGKSLVQEISYLWIKDRFDNLALEDEELRSIQEEQGKELRYLAEIEAFLKSQEDSERLCEWLREHSPEEEI